MSALPITPGDVVVKDPGPDVDLVYQFDWTDYLTERSRTIDVSTFAITEGDTDADPAIDTVLTADNASIVTGALKTQVRVLGGTLGQQYRVTNHITMTGSPAMSDERSFFVLIGER